MKIEKRMIGGMEREVHVHGSEEEYLELEKDRRNIAHAKVVAETLAQDPSFIISLGKSIVYQMKEEGLVVSS